MAEEREYLTVMDVYPQQYEDSTRTYKFYEYLREGKLATTKCKTCGQIHWPPGIICPECISDDLEWVEMPRTGVIYTYTVQYAGLPAGLEPPIVYALIDFEGGIRMLSALVDTKPEEVKTGLEVELRPQKVTPDQQGRERLVPYFTLKR